MSKLSPTPNSAVHTPGPWEVRKSLADQTYTHIAAKGNSSVACTKSEADARLIATAPDLLAALEGLLAITNSYAPEAKAAQIAIAKTRSEPQWP